MVFAIIFNRTCNLTEKCITVCTVKRVASSQCIQIRAGGGNGLRAGDSPGPLALIGSSKRESFSVDQ